MLGWVLFAITFLLLVSAAVLNRCELNRMERFLSERDPLSNSRMTVGIPSKTYAKLAQSINAQIDQIDTQRQNMELDRLAFQKQLASLSHDIRTPLAGAKGYLQLASAEPDEALARDYRAKAWDRMNAMEVLLDQLFAYSQVIDKERELTFEELNPISILTDVLAQRFDEFEARGWEPSIEIDSCDVLIEADTTAMYRIFENLIQNALVYGTAAPSIQASSHAISISNPVLDSTSLDVQRLFERFYRGDASRRVPGTGLGLSVVKSLCDAQGMSVDAKLEHGVFTITVQF